MTHTSRFRFKLASMAILASQLMACASSQNVDFSAIHQANQCGFAEAGIIQLDHTKHTWMINKLMPVSDESTRQAFQALLEDHAREETLLVIAQGTKPTLGYGFKVMAKVATINNSTLLLPILFSQPAKNKMLAQILTSPCMIVGIDSNAHYQKIEVDTLKLDISGQIN